MMQLNNDYQHDDFIKFLEEDFLTDFKRDVRPVNTSSLTCINKAQYLGESKGLDLQVFEFVFEGSANKRVALTKDAFSVMRSSAIYNALAVFHSGDNKDWRFSLLTATPEPTEKGKVSLTYSNPKRLSFFLGPNAKINTPTKFLQSKGKIIDFNDLKSRFSIEVVNKEFYKEISQAFTKLVSGQLKLPSTQDKSQTNLEFAVRLIGRIIFCWFLREKKSVEGIPLMPKDLLSINAVQKNKDYYHNILEPIFFEILNKPVKSRREDFAKEPFSSVPYLNGGLFSPQEDDFYKRMNGDLQSQFHNTLVIPDSWLNSFFEILETYNFTIDENTSYDEELSIDPEMLGRIFENLLAEINPETGESARKSTGSYYTPRTIVNYMVDESLLLYLKEQTSIKEEKLRAIISYDLTDDSENPVVSGDKENIVEALEKIKILDPACGSGAFPIGALQKIVFILQQIDPDGQMWFKKQIKNTSPEVRRAIEREFENKNFDYIRKLGIIRENIYGIDIQSIATEISRLRCFLTLIVDERIQDGVENRGIEPLPNLDFKFVTANSLIGLPKIDTNQQELFDDNIKIEELKSLRDQYFSSKNDERKDLMVSFSELQSEMINELIDKHSFTGMAKADLTRKLTDWKPFKHKTTDWFDPEWMFGIKNSFDIVIGNPPYLRVQGIKKANKEIALAYEKSYKSSTGSYDLYVLFVERGLKLLNSTGILNYIMPHKWTNSAFGLGLREIISSGKHFHKMISFGSYQIFNVSNYTSLLWLTNKINNKALFYKIKEDLGLNIDLDVLLKHLDERDFTEIDTAIFGKDEWILVDKTTAKILDKINKQPQRAKDIFNRIFQGIASGADSIFFLEPIEHNNNSVSCYSRFNKETVEIEKDVLKPLLKGKDIKRFKTPISKLYVILPYKITPSGAVPFTEMELKDRFPKAYKYLLRNKQYLAKREEGRFDNEREWFLFSRNQGLNEAMKPKIITPEISFGTNFTYDEGGNFYHNTKCYSLIKKNSIKEGYKYFLGVLNSNLLWFFLQSTGYVLRGGYFTFSTKYLEPFPIPTSIEQKTEDEISNLVDKIISLRTQNPLGNAEDVDIYEKKINQIVYKLYGLTAEDVEIIEKYNDPTNKSNK